MSLDFESPEFDPEAALASNPEDVTLPFGEATALRNLSEYENLTKGLKRANRQSNKSKKGMPARSLDPATVFIPSVKTQRHSRNVLTLMEGAEGPLGRLRECISDRIRIKVWTRRAKEIRGVCVAFVVAFDKHWNLILSDVDETFILPSKVKTLVHGPPLPIPDPESRQGLPKLSYQPRELDSDDKDLVSKFLQRRKAVLKQRYSSQLFVRGENVAFISIPTT